MKRLPIAIALGLALIAGGCRSTGNQELVERELRWQEDRIRHLESNICACQQQLEACQQENSTLKRQLGSSGDIPFGSSVDVPLVRPRLMDRNPDERSPSDFVPPNVQLPGVEQAPPFQGPPQISPPNPSVPEGEPPPAKAPMTRSTTPAEPTGLPESDLPPPSGPALEPRLIPSADGGDPSRVTKITLNPAQTGGYNADDLPGDEGVSVLVEPRDASGALLRAAGKLSIVVLDPTLSGDAARVARWNFTEEDAAAHHRPGTDALRFDLRWPERLPQNPNLKLYVRFTRADGRKFDAEKDLRVAVPPRTAADWKRSAQPAPPKTAPIETTPIAPAAAPRGGSDQPASQPAATSGDRTAVRSGVQWTPYR